MMIYWIFLFFITHFIISLRAVNLLDICQSGIRDDGTNYVHCARKSLNEIPAFSSNRQFNLAFDELILSDNTISHIRANAFNGLRIKRLIMSGNLLKSIDQNAFRELKNYLEELILEFDPTIVDTIPHAVRMNLGNLRSLTLIGLNLRRLTANSFVQMKKLENLALKSCRIQKLEPNAFHSLEQQLRQLYLDSNQLTNDIFLEIKRLTALETLSLSHNFIDELSMPMINPKLRHLDLSYNQVKRIILINMNYLEVINLQNNLLTTEQIFGTWPKQLRELILDFNAIHTLQHHFVDDDNSLEILSLQSNDFQLMDAKIFQRLNRLKKLNLARNNIQHLPIGLFNSTRKLEDLNLDRNPLKTLPIETFSGIEYSLKNLSCQFCSLTSDALPALFNLIHLERFKFQSNFFTEIHPNHFFSSMTQLVLIDLQRNQLTDIPSELPSSLRELQLANNRLRKFPFLNRTLDNLSHLTTLDFSQNPLHCDCQMKSLYQWLFAHFQAELVPYVQWVCATPSTLTGKKLGALKENDFVCEEKKISSFQIENRIKSFNVWIKDVETVILEWALNSNDGTILKLQVIENNFSLPILELNQTENYFLLEKLKSSTNYSFCLQFDQQTECRQITTKSRQIVSLSSKTIESSTNTSFILFDVEYLIIAISLSIILVLIILFFLIAFLVKQRHKLRSSSKATSIDSYYQTTGSETTQIGPCHHSYEDRTLQTLKYPQVPIFCSCQLSSIYAHESPPNAYHLYHEIAYSKSPTII